MTNAGSGVAVTVVAGSARVRTRSFAAGVAEGPIAVGSHGEWQIAAPDVAAIHLYLAFDGSQLHVAAASEQDRVLLRGSPVGRLWRAALVPSEIHFGAACVIVLPAEVHQPDSGDGIAELAEDEGVTYFRHSPMDAMDACADMDPPTLVHSALTVVAPSKVAALAAAMLDKPVARSTSVAALLESEAPTLFDGGALRAQAAQIAQAVQADHAVRTAQTAQAITGATGALGSLLAKSNEPQVAMFPGVTRGTDSAATGGAAVAKRTDVREFLAKFVVSWREATRLQRAICILVPCALCAGFWPQDSDAHIRAEPPAQSQPRRTKSVTATAEPNHSPNMDASTTATAAVAPGPNHLPTIDASATAATVMAPSPTEAAATPTSRGEPPNEPPTQPSVAASPAGSAGPMRNGGSAHAASTTSTSPTNSLTQTASTAQRDAFNAAKLGKLSEAAEIYQRLGVTSNSPVFAKAARLAGSKAVRTP
ncbi:MAG TPA: hypothetical protein VKP30_00765 [Polyangiaceae bacterium]|nr:hypothetical protein [Polyangiaceae bacterium]